MEKFLHSDVDKFALSIFVKIRISNSNLNIERGRYIKLPVEKRICPLCNIEPEDEIHFILKCPKLDECRKELFSNISSVVTSFNDMDEFQKFTFILSSMGRSPNYGRNSNIFHITNGLNFMRRK
jgi:hypothetical protein